jgi:integrase
MLQTFCNDLLITHAKASVKKIFIVIRGALNDAVKDNVILKNPERLVTLPKLERYYNGVSLTKDETIRLLKIVENEQEPLRATITLALCYGMRRSEVCGLRWKDIDFEKNTMHIRNTVTQNGKLLLEGEHTKTKSSKRVLSLVGWTVPYLKELYEKQKESGIQLDKVVAWPDGHYVRPDSLSRAFYKLLKRNGFEKIRFHDLRHTAATILAESGLKPKHLQAFLGHSDVEMALNVYVHTPSDCVVEASQKMDEILGNVSLHPEER